MAEPKEKATRLIRVLPHLVRWSVRQNRIGGLPGESYAVGDGRTQVWIDPLPLGASAIEALGAQGRMQAIALTIQTHQRASWRYGEHFKVPVYAPWRAQGLDAIPDRQYRAGAKLPGGLRAIHLPGPAFSGYGLWWESERGRVLFCGDLITTASGRPALVPDQYMDSPELARKSLEKLLDESIDVLCPGHGAPIVGGVRQALEGLWQRDQELPASPLRRRSSAASRDV